MCISYLLVVNQSYHISCKRYNILQSRCHFQDQDITFCNRYYHYIPFDDKVITSYDQDHILQSRYHIVWQRYHILWLKNHTSNQDITFYYKDITFHYISALRYHITK